MKKRLLLSRSYIILFTAIASTVIAGTMLQRQLFTDQEVLSPDSFDDPATRHAYEIAHEIPEVLGNLQCFCGCMSNKNKHKSNLDCFKSTHAAYCGVCIEIALNANRQKQAGKSLSAIQRYVHNVYGFDVKHQPEETPGQ